MRELNQTGDTIIEVLIAIGVIGVVLVAGFVLTNFSLTSERNSQERNIALNILQSQIEQLRRLSAPVAQPLAQNFCIISTAGSATPVALYPGNPSNSDDGNPNPQCEFNSSGQNGDSSTQPIFTIDLCYFDKNHGTTHDEYWARVRWVPLGGGKQDQINSYYRIYYN